MIKLSFILSVYNELNNLHELVERINKVVDKLGVDHELIFIDDGSTDGSIQWLRQFSEQNDNAIVIEFSRNFGHEAAMKAGIDICSGDFAVIMDTDLQHPPETVSEMFELWQKGFKIIHGVRIKNQDMGFLQDFSSKLFYKIFNLFSSYKIPHNATDFKMLDKNVIDYLKQMNEKYIFLRGLIGFAGFTQTSVDFESPKRKHGRSSYSTYKLIKLAFNGFLSFSLAPLRIIQYLGLVFCVLSIPYGLSAVIRRLFFDVPFGFTAILASLLFLGSIQLISLGIIGEYVGRIYIETKNRPIYIINKKSGKNEIDNSSDS